MVWPGAWFENNKLQTWSHFPPNLSLWQPLNAPINSKHSVFIPRTHTPSKPWREGCVSSAIPWDLPQSRQVAPALLHPIFPSAHKDTKASPRHVGHSASGHSSLSLPLCERKILFQGTNFLGLGQCPLPRLGKRPEQKSLWPAAFTQTAANFHWPCRIQAALQMWVMWICSFPLYSPVCSLPQPSYIRWANTLCWCQIEVLHWKNPICFCFFSLWSTNQCLGHAAAPVQECTKGKFVFSAGQFTRPTVIVFWFWAEETDKAFYLFIKALYLFVCHRLLMHQSFG